MTYTNEEKQIAKNFIECKIPEYIYDYYEKFNKKHNLNVDTMEFYEALFDFAHCILADINFESDFAKALTNKELYFLIMQQNNNFNEQDFSDKVSKLFEVIEKHMKL